MAVFYPQIRDVHVLSATLSGGLFALRGACTLAGMRWPRAAPVRYASYTIDTTLLTAALNGSLRNAQFRTDKYFGFAVPTALPGVPTVAGPEAAVSISRLSPTASRPASLKKVASSNWPTTDGSVEP